MMDADHAYRELIQRIKEARLLESVGSVLGWDERTYMPSQGSAHRAEQMALLARLTHEQLTVPRLGELLSIVETSPLVREADSDAAANAREIRRVYDRVVKLPAELVEELARTTTRAQGVWQEARKHNDFATFRPWLEKIITLKRKEAQAIGYKQVPYDALLEEYEPGATTAEITELFAALRKDLVPRLFNPANVRATKSSSASIPWTASRSSARKPPPPSVSTLPPAGST
jgi:carboxypeptidase Taq